MPFLFSIFTQIQYNAVKDTKSIFEKERRRKAAKAFDDRCLRIPSPSKVHKPSVKWFTQLTVTSPNDWSMYVGSCVIKKMHSQCMYGFCFMWNNISRVEVGVKYTDGEWLKCTYE